jgi:myo-inositol 2-dehydrogenase/D-chiro-inositol 1-dehydrogenase
VCSSDLVTEVFAKGATLIDPTLSEINDIDTLALVLKFENGGFALIDNSRRAVYGYDQRVEVFGSQGMLKAENLTNSTVETYTAQATVLDRPLPIFNERYRQAYKEEVLAFASSLLTGAPFIATPIDVIMAQRVAMAAIKSIQTGQAVAVDPQEPII